MFFLINILLDYDQVVGSDNNTRWYSAITGGRCGIARDSTRLNLKSGLLLGGRHESTAAASSDSSNPPPAEKYEYQAEVCWDWDSLLNL